MRGFDAVPFDRALRGNPSYFEMSPLTNRRARFFKLVSRMSVQAATERILQGGGALPICQGRVATEQTYANEGVR